MMGSNASPQEVRKNEIFVPQNLLKKIRSRTSIKKSLSPKKALVWALQPDEADPKIYQKCLDMARLLVGKDESILPVSILSPIDLGWPMELKGKIRKEILASAKSKSEGIFLKIASKISSAEILVSSENSLSTSVRKFLSYAKRRQAEMVLLYSRQSDEKRITGFGSFTEQAISSSKIPLVVIGKNTKVPSKISRILLPTDFSRTRRKSFQTSIELAKKWGADLILFHKVGAPLAPASMVTFGSQMEAAWLENAWAEQKEIEEQTAHRWQQEAIRKGVKCELVLEMSASDWNLKSLQVAKKTKADLIVISHRRGVWGQTLFGGQVRRLFSQSSCPLLLIHT